MFVLTCPSCSHEVKTRFARLGATATCPSCKTQYKVDEQSLKMESGAPAAEADASQKPAEPEAGASPTGQGATEEPVMSSPPVEELKVKRPPLKKKKPEKAESPAETNPSAELAAAVSEDDSDAAAPAEPADSHEHHRHAKPVRRRRKRGLDVKLVAMMLVMLALLIVVVALVVQRSTREPTVVLDGQPPAEQPVEPVPQPEPRPRPAPEPVADIPVLELEPPTLVTSNWSRLRTPVDPIVPMSNPEVVLWDAQLMKSGDGQRSMVNGLYVADSPKVYRRGVLRVQLTNDTGMVFAERQMFVPVVCSRDGLQVRVPVPNDLLEADPGLTCEFTPIDPVAGGMALEMDESKIENVGGPGAPVYKLAVHNPHNRAVTNPTLVIDVITPDGWPLGSWQGTLDTTIGPGQTLIFQAAPPIESGSTVGRIIVRGYGRRA